MISEKHRLHTKKTVNKFIKNSKNNSKINEFEKILVDNLMCFKIHLQDLEIFEQLLNQLLTNGVTLNIQLIENLLNLISMRRMYLLNLKLGTKRNLREKINLRVRNLDGIMKIYKFDNIGVIKIINSKYFFKQLNLILVENALLKIKEKNKLNNQDQMGINVQLYLLKHHLCSQNLTKVSELLTDVLCKIDLYFQRKTTWKSSTINNKISQASRLIKDVSPCHQPIKVHNWPYINDTTSIKALSGGCSKCQKSWEEYLKIKSSMKPTILESAKEINSKLPTLGTLIRELMNNYLKWEGYSDAEIVNLSSELKIDLKKLKNDVFRSY